LFSSGSGNCFFYNYALCPPQAPLAKYLLHQWTLKNRHFYTISQAQWRGLTSGQSSGKTTFSEGMTSSSQRNRQKQIFHLDLILKITQSLIDVVAVVVGI
jgi:hypothetical protein